jgi:hypothetical protein
VALIGLLSACGVAEGPAFLRFEGKVITEGSQPLIGQDVRIQLAFAESDHPAENGIASELAQTDSAGKFMVETSRYAGGLLIIPMAVIVAPIGGVVAAFTSWTFREVYDFLSPAYFLGSRCLPHPKDIALRIDSVSYQTRFLREDIVDKLYRGTEENNGGLCTRVYDLGELMISAGAASR